MNGALYPDDFPEEPVAGITDDEVEDFLAGIGKADECAGDGRRARAAMLDELTRDDDSGMSLMAAIDHLKELTCDVADCERIYCMAINTVIRYALSAADLLDGDR